MIRYQVIDWDTKYFGFPVARIFPDTMGREELARMIASLQGAGVRLAYWASDPNDVQSQEAAAACGGFLADRKVTYLIDLAGNQDPSVAVAWAVERYAGPQCCAELEELSLRICAYSRFKSDPRMPEGACEEIYRMWIRNSANRTIADDVLVIRDSGRIAGMVTLGEKQGRADIGLLSVAAGMEGKNVGVSLVRAAQAWAREKNYRFAQVVTQGENAAARRLYEKCGYKIERIEHFFHFWI